MPTKGRSHFDSYTEQNRAKHAILTKYFGAYLKALSHAADAFHYIDGFAGRGRYGADQSGSPLYALELLMGQRKPATASFVENDPALFAELEASVERSLVYSSLIEPPLLRRGEFSDCLDEILHREALRRFRKVATFAFVDPCGLTGLYMADLGKMLSLPFGECLVFLNYDGLNRWLGGVIAETHARDKIDRFFGSTSATAAAIECVQSNIPSSLREQRLLDLYLQTVRLQSSARFVLPFRFRAPGRERTSHYLIHLSQHPLAFTIMKAVMRSESSATDDIGSFGFIPADELADQGELFRPNAERARTKILEELRRGRRPVSLFATQWPQRPEDMLVSSEYRRLLLDLEREGLVEIVNPSTDAVVHASDRPKRSGVPTLGDRHFVRLRKRDPI